MRRLTIYYCLLTIYAILNTQYESRAFGQGSQITQGGSAYAISSPFESEDLFEIQYIQSADIMYLVHQYYHPQMLSRYGDTNWTIEDVNLIRGPFMQENTSAGWTLKPSDTTGDITISASLDTFYAGHVGSMFQMVQPVDANVISNVRFARGDSNSLELEVQINRDFTAKITNGNYLNEGNITLQRSYDDVTWRDVYNFETSSPEVIYMDTETVDDAIYRFNFVDIAYGYFNIPKDNLPRYSLTAHAFEQEGIVEITSVSGPRYANATVLYALGDTSATYKWSEGSFSGYRGYPSAVAIHRERLMFGGTAAEPDTIWYSQTDDWHNFLITNLDTSAGSFTLSADQIDIIRWLISKKDLIIGTSGAEWIMETPSGKPVADSQIKRQSTYGSAAIQAHLINHQVVYVQRNAQKILRMKYYYEADNYNSVDLTLLSEHITEDGVVELAYQRVPFSILWSVCENGDLLALVLEDNQDILGWSRYVFDGDCESVAVIPGPGEDQVWVIIAREINGSTVRYIEQFMPFEFADQDSAFYVDSGLSFDGGDAVTVTNISQADPAVATAPEHSFTDGEQVRFTSVGGMTELNNNIYTVSTVSGASFELRDSTDAVDINSVDFTAYTSGGSIEQVENIFTTLTHLEGESVAAAGDGGYAGDYTVSSSTVTLDAFYNRVHIGLPFTAKLKPMKLDFLTTAGALQGRTKRISATTVRFYETLSCSIGPDFDDYDSFTFRDADDLLEAATPIFSGDKYLLFPGGFETAGDICIQDSLPVPLTVLGIIVDYEVER